MCFKIPILWIPGRLYNLSRGNLKICFFRCVFSNLLEPLLHGRLSKVAIYVLSGAI